MATHIAIHKFIPAVSLAALLTGCAPDLDTRGYETENRDFSKIVPGSSNKQFVEENFGSPSTLSTFHPETWYYVSKKTATTSFFNPKVLEQKAYAVVFDNNDTVTNVIVRTGDEVHEINPVKRVTPTAGYESGLLREVFSNFGKISAKSPSGPPR